MRYYSRTDVVDEGQSNVVSCVEEGEDNQVASILEIAFTRERSVAA
jgi:hypothetical protein